MRKRDYQLIRELGAGACGKTVLLYDDVIDEHFVCKKYHPYDEAVREELFGGFLREIKLLHQLHHKNVVRVFNYYVYPDEFTGYILMEFVDGDDIQTHLTANPEHANQLFLQAVSGFQYMEDMGVLHRDIRPLNLMVTADGELKIIDLGFGKRIVDSTDFDKSISLNWWCDTPEEFTGKKYDYKTEVYFVGKLFEKLIVENSIGNFQQTDILRGMCMRNPDERISSFSDVAKAIRTERFPEIEFSYSQTQAYRKFADNLADVLSKIERGTKYKDDVDKIKRQLADAYRTFMLEITVPDTAVVTRCFLDGTYYYKKRGLAVQTVKGFIDLLQSCSPEQAKIVLANLQTKLDTVQRYSKQELDYDNIPF
ncbi:MAG: protein kinase [Thermosynechococcaceae cyanobacterium MS004]|nr:protein kinase [Thermosynechococcaceae cyanobacterium MS004]